MSPDSDTATPTDATTAPDASPAASDSTPSASSTGSRPLRIGLGILGILIFLLGVLTVVAPSAAAVPLRALVAAAGNDYVLVAILGIPALLLGLLVIAVRGKTGLDQASPPPPEQVYPVARHGEPIDEFLSDGGLGDVAETDHYERMQTRLRSIAVTAVMRADNCTKATAQERVETGTWTDEKAAASFLAEAETPGLGARLKAALTGSSPYRQAARVTAAEIARLDEEASR